MNRPGILVLISLGLIIAAGLAVWLFTHARGFGVVAAVPRAGSQVALVAYEGPTSYGNLYLLGADTGEITQVTRGGGVRWASWLPDGEHLQIVRHENGEADVYLLNVSAGSLEAAPDDVVPEVADDPERASARQLSPDGRHLLVVEDTRGEWGGVVRQQLLVADPDGGDPQLLSDELDQFTPVHWSPDARYVLFQAAGRVCRSDVMTGERECPFHGNYPVWSPEGDLLAYGIWKPGEAPGEVGQICVSRWVEGRQCYGEFPGRVYPVGWRPGPAPG